MDRNRTFTKREIQAWNAKSLSCSCACVNSGNHQTAPRRITHSHIENQLPKMEGPIVMGSMWVIVLQRTIYSKLQMFKPLLSGCE